MIRLINPNDSEVHIQDPRTKLTTIVSPHGKSRVKSKVYEIVIEEKDIKHFQAFMKLGMLKSEVVSPVKSPATETAAVDANPVKEPVVPASVPARKINGPNPDDIEARINNPPVPAIPRRKA